MIIGNLVGLFDGDKYHPGPLSIHISGNKIEHIEFSERNDFDLNGVGKIASLPFADGHTHMIFGGNRFFELEPKLEGKKYEEILAMGGGIQSTMRSTREASDESLLTSVLHRLDQMLAHGTSVVEAKSGYGLNTEHEIRLLEILNKANEMHPIELVPTFGAAHVYPPDVPKLQYLEEILDVMLPEVVERSLATTTDVFCDKGAFGIDDTIQILERSTKLGLPVRVHAEELVYTGIGKIASEKFGALSVDHLLHERQDDFNIYAQNDTVAMFMPMAPIGLFTDHKPTGFHQSGVTLGLGSDFNPNNWVISMQSAIRMGVFTYRITPLHAFRAATSGSYLGITGERRELLQEGSKANLLLLDGKSIAEVVSKFGVNLVTDVFIDGEHLIKDLQS